MVFAPYVSPALLVRRDMLGYAASEAVRYGTTVKEVIDAFFAGRPRPGLAAMLDRAYAAAGLPPAETMALVARFFDAEEIETGDLLVVLEAHRDRLPTTQQARELVEAAQRLARRARQHERAVKAAQASYDARVVENATDPPPEVRPTRRPVRARAVQRYSGIGR